MKPRSVPPDNRPMGEVALKDGRTDRQTDGRPYNHQIIDKRVKLLWRADGRTDGLRRRASAASMAFTCGSSCSAVRSERLPTWQAGREEVGTPVPQRELLPVTCASTLTRCHKLHGPHLLQTSCSFQLIPSWMRTEILKRMAKSRLCPAHAIDLQSCAATGAGR